jgi:hypothetical protein
MTLQEAFERILDKSPIIYPCKPETCNICKRIEECRAGVCFHCKNDIRITEDMTEVYLFSNPEIRWPFRYRGEPDL